MCGFGCVFCIVGGDLFYVFYVFEYVLYVLEVVVGEYGCFVV